MGRLSGLDTLRGIAAILVVLMHADHLSGTPGWFADGYLAVDFFFLLSGYVLARAFDRRLATDLSPIGFLRIRIRRLWPVMAIGAILGLISFLQIFGSVVAMALFVLALLIAPQLWAPTYPAFPSNPPTWSISVELIANALHCLLFVRMSNAGLFAVSASCLAVLITFAPDFDVGVMPGDLWLGAARVGLSYPIGMLIWRLARDRPRCPPQYAILALPALILVSSQLGPWFDIAFVVLACPLILIGGLGRSRFGPALGAISFPLYAVHYPILRGVIDNGGSKWLAVILAIGVASLVAWRLEPRRRYSAADQPSAEPALTTL